MTKKIISQTLASQIADKLREEILFGDLKPGDRILEENLAQVYDVSRIPIREALKTLDSEGYIEIIPYKGNIVKRPNEMELWEATAIHAALYPVVLKKSFPNFTNQDYKNIADLLEQVDLCTDYRTYNKLHYQLLDGFCTPSKMLYATKILKDVMRTNVRGLEIFFENLNHKQSLTKHLRELIAVVQEGKYDEALAMDIEFNEKLKHEITINLLEEEKRNKKI